jgi:hypothetical protein
MRKFRRHLAAVALALSLSIGASGCYGSFALTRWVYDFNGKVTDNKFVHSIVTWAFLIVPVYSIAGFVDFVVLNMIEFWTEQPVINLPQAPRVQVSENGTVDVDLGGTAMRFVPAGDGSWAVERGGQPVGSITAAADGGLLVRDLDGRVLTTFAAADVMAAQGRLDQLLTANGG